MRLFLALEIPHPARAHLAVVQQALRSRLPHLRYIPEANLHLTMKFLGELADARVVQVTDALRPLAIPTLQLHAADLLTFPPRGPLRIVGVSLAGDLPPLLDLQQQIEAACANLGFTRETRPFKPHVTIARSPDRPRTSASTVPSGNDLFPGPPFTVTSLTLMQSDLRSGGPVYTPVAHFGDA